MFIVLLFMDCVPWLPTDIWILSTLWELAAGEKKKSKLAISMRQCLQSWLYFIISHDTYQYCYHGRRLVSICILSDRLNLQQKGRECCCPKNHMSWPAFKLHLTMQHDAFMNPTQKASITSLWDTNNENSRILTVLHNLTHYCCQREQVPTVDI